MVEGFDVIDYLDASDDDGTPVIVLDPDIDDILCLRSGNVSITKSRNSNKAPTSFCSSCNAEKKRKLNYCKTNRISFRNENEKKTQKSFTFLTWFEYVNKHTVTVTLRITILINSQRPTVTMNFKAKSVASIKFNSIINISNRTQVSSHGDDSNSNFQFFLCFSRWPMTLATHRVHKTQKSTAAAAAIRKSTEFVHGTTLSDPTIGEISFSTLESWLIN